MSGYLQRVLTRILALMAAGGVAMPVPLPGQVPEDRQAVVTLVEARRLAAAVAPAGVAARAQVAAAAWERRAAVLDLFTPSITAGTSYTHFSDPFFNFGTGEISPNATSATLQASYTLLGSGKLFGLRRSRASLAAAEANETAARYRTALTTEAAFFAVVADRERVRVAADRRRRAEEQLGVARVRVLAGDAIAADSLQLLLELNRARLEQLRRDSGLTVSRLRLGRQVGLAGPVEAAPVDTAAPPPLPLARDAAVAEMLRLGPEIVAARAADAQASAVLGTERAGYLPDVVLSASTGAYDANFFPSALKRSQLAVTVSLPIWDAGQREAAVARARAQRDAARAERLDRERGAAEAMAAAHNGYGTARAGIELALAGVALSVETYRVQGVRYREGATTILDLLEAQVSLSEAEAALVQARYAARLALAEIEALLGRRVFDTDAEPTIR